LLSMQYFEPGVFFVKNLSFDKSDSLIHGLLVSYPIAVIQAAQRQASGAANSESAADAVCRRLHALVGRA